MAHARTPGLHLHLLNADGGLQPYTDALEQRIAQTWDRVAPLLQLPSVDIVVHRDPGNIIAEWGVGGYTPSAHLVYLAIDTQRLSRQPEAVLQYLHRITAHELHHCARWSAPGYGTTLGEALVSEGLACLFEAEQSDQIPPFYATALNADDQQRLYAQAITEKDTQPYNHYQWFFGTHPERITRHAGYSLGYALVAEYARHTSSNATALAHLPADAIWKNAAPPVSEK